MGGRPHHHFLPDDIATKSSAASAKQRGHFCRGNGSHLEPLQALLVLATQEASFGSSDTEVPLSAACPLWSSVKQSHQVLLSVQSPGEITPGGHGEVLGILPGSIASKLSLIKGTKWLYNCRGDLIT